MSLVYLFELFVSNPEINIPSSFWDKATNNDSEPNYNLNLIPSAAKYTKIRENFIFRGDQAHFIYFWNRNSFCERRITELFVSNPEINIPSSFWDKANNNDSEPNYNLNLIPSAAKYTKIRENFIFRGDQAHFIYFWNRNSFCERRITELFVSNPEINIPSSFWDKATNNDSEPNFNLNLIPSAAKYTKIR